MRGELENNPGLLKLHLFCQGLHLDPSCDIERDGRPIRRTRAGLGSGLELVLPDGLYVNVPVLEKWVAGTPFSLHRQAGRYGLRHDGRHLCDVRLPPPPAFYERKTTSGVPMSRVGVLQGTYLADYPTAVCHYWEHRPRVCCKFCSVGLNLGENEDAEKTVQDVVETAMAARKETGITFVHFNTGYYEGDSSLDRIEPYVAAVKKATGLLIGVQAPPHPDFGRYDRLRQLGVNNVSFCLELWDQDRFAQICPGKAAHVGRQRYLDAIRYCARVFDTTNGELVAGLEPAERTIEAIDWITDVGAIPTVCVFRPLQGTELEDAAPPTPEAMIPIFRHLYEACRRRRLPLGMAPRIKVGIVLLPEEGRYFLEEENRYRWAELRAVPLRALFRTAFYGKLAVRSLLRRG